MPFQTPKQDEAALDDDLNVDAGIFAEINITPLTDVILVLLIIFMLSSSAMVDAIRQGKLDVTLPQSAAGAKDAIPEESLVVGIAADGRIFVKGEFISDTELDTLLKETQQRAPRTAVVIEADGDLQHKNVVKVIDKVRSAGFAMVGIGTETNE